ncbi:Nramp family divalent metal transporter [Duganella callida]|uniref:Mn(2+) uptake NRAMP transporter MntH n=1 Tax=Duganella callida TaxID=2561932 RepID=A0A4Y9SI76_9BURK|nr:Nramp family divalent metal transporter [Duganella callida]TFW24332.1 Mn(2+) uptake NRAMP transporter MntH [Duganella callida]
MTATAATALPVPPASPRPARSLLAFAGPAVIASVAYMDPGNFATNIEAGSRYGYQLLWVVLLSSLVAMLFQAMSAKLGIVTGHSLAELCRAQFSRPVVIGMWLGAEIAAIATDLAEFMGGALGISLLFHLALGWGLLITGMLTVLILSLDRHGLRPLEIAIGALVAVIGLSYLAELLIAPPDWPAALFHSVVPQLHGHDALMLAVGIVGATIMPHSIYLHSGLTGQRAPAVNDAQRRRLLRWSNREVVLALGLAALVNMAMVAMSARAFSRTAPGLADIAAAYRTLAPALGAGAAGLFLVSLLASGISSSVVGTMAGQHIMQGFVGFRVPLLARRLITMVPAVLVCLVTDPMRAMLGSQVVLSILLPLPLIALVVLSARPSVMGRFAACRKLTWTASAATAAIVLLNAALIWQALA